MRTNEQTQHTQADDLTRYMLHLCYTCDDANRCTTEEAVRACMAAHAETDQPEPAEGVDVTRGYLDMMYA
ncbi:hypothetical protein [Paenibacillus silvae]|uniref:Uncharacterized protein n=1 Tax=Paenibacillus silvae TaxID=1325358 RepID=A0A2W6N910_9BACL|nr:hypothetical protein [Paenibacillus silvae]MCK6076952.1 hypothetical protein [Paenibacillus silvae]MCK6152712.1 hypothetical protein [Paenibacillus silvae]MCK6269541.1 hypothetical protein [Paenibacillus silvae]PZT52432.1 hypothetical protein DN757_27290 [Paenibacillus silvae]